MTKIKFTRTTTQPHRNRKFRQFNNDQYCSNTEELQYELSLRQYHLHILLIHLDIFVSTLHVQQKLSSASSDLSGQGST